MRLGEKRLLKVLLIIFLLFASLTVLLLVGFGGPLAPFKIGWTLAKYVTLGESPYETMETSRYSSWNWTPDGRIIYVKDAYIIRHFRGAGRLGYERLGNETQICIINKDGSNNQVIKRIPYLDKIELLNQRVRQIARDKYGIKNTFWVWNRRSKQVDMAEQQALAEEKAGTLDNPPLSRIGWIDWNKNNKKLVFVANDGTGKTGIAISDPELKEIKWIYKQDNDRIFYTKWSPDGNWVAFTRVGKPGGLSLIDLYGKVIILDEANNYIGIDWLPNDKDLITLSCKKEDNGLVIIDLQGKIIRRLKVDGGNPSLSPDGQWVVYSDVVTKIVDINGQNKRILSSRGVFYPKWSPDGKKILFGWEGGIFTINPDGYGYFEVTKEERE